MDIEMTDTEIIEEKVGIVDFILYSDIEIWIDALLSFILLTIVINVLRW